MPTFEGSRHPGEAAHARSNLRPMRSWKRSTCSHINLHLQIVHTRTCPQYSLAENLQLCPTHTHTHMAAVLRVTLLQGTYAMATVELAQYRPKPTAGMGPADLTTPLLLLTAPLPQGLWPQTPTQRQQTAPRLYRPDQHPATPPRRATTNCTAAARFQP